MNKHVQNISEFKAEEPQPLFRKFSISKSYPVDALGPLADTVRAVQDKTQAPIAIAAQSALSIASLAVQAFGDVETLGGSVPCSLFALTIAQSGERKSGCDKLLMKAIREYEQDAQSIYNEEAKQYAIDYKIWEKEKEKLVSEVIKTKDKVKKTATQADLKVYPLPPLPPRAPNRTATEPTFEGLTKLFQVSHPSLGLFTDEGGGFIGGHAMNKENGLKTCAGLSSLWDGSPINRTRAGDGTITMYGRRLAAHIMAQPIAARPMLADPVASGQGFLARFLICEPASAIGTRTRRGYDEISDTHIIRFSEKLRALLETEPPLKEANSQELEPPVLVLSSGARELLFEFYEATEIGQIDGGKYASIRPYASKSAEQAARIAGVLSLWDSLEASEISAQKMTNGIALAQFYLGEAKRLADAALVSEKASRADGLRLWLLNSWKHEDIIPSEVVQFGPNALRSTELAKEALEVLLEHKWLIPLEANTVIRGASRSIAFKIIRFAKAG